MSMVMNTTTSTLLLGHPLGYLLGHVLALFLGDIFALFLRDTPALLFRDIMAFFSGDVFAFLSGNLNESQSQDCTWSRTIMSPPDGTQSPRRPCRKGFGTLDQTWFHTAFRTCLHIAERI